MISFRWILGLVCIFVIHGDTRADVLTNEVYSDEIDSQYDSNAADMVPFTEKVVVDLHMMEIDLQGSFLDMIVEYKGLDSTFESIEFQNQCNSECQSIIVEIKSIQDRWLSGFRLQIPILGGWLDLAIKRKFEEFFCIHHVQSHERDLLISHIDGQIEDLSGIESNLATTSSSFKLTIDKLNTTISTLAQYSYLSPYQSAYFGNHIEFLNNIKTQQKSYQILKIDLENYVKVIDHTQSILKEKIAFMGELRVQTVQSNELISTEAYTKLTAGRTTALKSLYIRAVIELVRRFWSPLTKLYTDNIFRTIVSNIPTIWNSFKDLLAYFRSNGPKLSGVESVSPVSIYVPESTHEQESIPIAHTDEQQSTPIAPMPFAYSNEQSIPTMTIRTIVWNNNS